MKLRRRSGIVGFFIIGSIVVIAGFSYLVAYNISKAPGTETLKPLGSTIYALITVSALIAVSGVIVFRAMINRLLERIEQINSFTQSMSQGHFIAKLNIEGPDEFNLLASNLNKIADSCKEKFFVLESAVVKRQKAVRELAILNELMGFITSEMRFDVILKSLVERTRDFIKSDYCAAIIFEPETFIVKTFVTSEGIQNPSTINIDPDGFFKKLLKEQIPLRFSSQSWNIPETQSEIRSEQEYKKIPELNLEVKDVLAVPLTSSSRLSGILLLANKLDGSFEQEDEDVLMDFAFQAFQTIAMHEEIANLAVTDGLTGLNNHRYFQERLSEEVEMARRYGRGLSLMILDVDNFKTFNDIYGHQVGDIVLRSIASIINEQIRRTDFAARYGGEEFAVIMPETSYNGARILAERLRKRIAETPFLLPNGDKAVITVSIGFASVPENTTDKTELIEMSDRSLYFAKERGRNLSRGFDEDLRYEKAEEYLEIEPMAIENLAHVIDSRTPYTKGHSTEVSKLAILLAKEMGLGESDIKSLGIASILHDVGTVNVPERILNKPSKLTEEEKKVIMAHPGLVGMVLKKYPHIDEVLPIILYHHERFDGKGYPSGITGEGIPLPARILAIAEAFNAMISARPYKKKITVEEAYRELRANAGSQFDPLLIDTFIKALTAMGYK